MNVTPKTLPSFKKEAFSCPYCGAFSMMMWIDLRSSWEHRAIDSGCEVKVKRTVYGAECSKCLSQSIWIEEKNDAIMLYPSSGFASALPAHHKMPDFIKADYDEALAVHGVSKKASAALLRLSLQKLLYYIGGKGDNIYSDINFLAEQKVISEKIKMVADILRIAGNNAVHPSKIKHSSFIEISDRLFGFINMIVEEVIAKGGADEVEKIYKILIESRT